MVGKLVLRNVRMFDGRGLTEPRAVVIDGSVIGEDPTGAREFDATGATLLPGLIDSHVHLRDPRDLATLASWGVTTGLDMACWPVERVASLRAITGAADFRTAGLPAIGPGGHHARMPGMPEAAIVLTPDDARRHVESRIGEGVDYVKAVAEAPGEGGPPADALHALVDAGREHGLDTVVHAAAAGAYAFAVRSGAAFVTHVPVLGRIRAQDIAAMRGAGQVAIPTITMMESILTDGPLAGRAPVGDPVRSLEDLHAEGVEILAGTDVNSAPGAPTTVRHGESLHRELQLMARAGMPNVDILRSATVLPALAFGLTDRGAIEPGLRADLVLLDGDPTADISATRGIRAVWCAGEPVHPEPPRV
ncbi:MAG: amidohydrolase family protein [Nocardioidaceae bacterium]